MGLFKGSEGQAAPTPFLERRHIRAVREFTPSWFTACMGTGATALAWGNIPYHFRGQAEIGMAIWSLNVLMFIFFSLLFLGRIIFFRDTIAPLMHHKVEPLFLGAIPMAFAVITNGFVLYFGPRLQMDVALQAACALWYVNLPATLGTSLILPFYIISRHENVPEAMTAAWLLPIVPANVAAGSAGVLAVAHAAQDGLLAAEHRGLVGSVVFIGCVLLSYGLLLSLSITAIYWNRLMVHRLPPAAQLISSFLPVGAISMCAFSSINLGSTALFKFPDADPNLKGVESTLHATGLFLGVILWSYAIWWLVIAIAAVIDNLRVLPFNLGWWGSVFPTGTMSVLTARLGGVLGIPALQAFSMVFTALNVSLWLLVAGMTLKKGWKGQLFYAPCLHTFNQAVADAGADKNKVARACSEMLCLDPGLSGLYESESIAGAGSPRGGSAGGAGGMPAVAEGAGSGVDGFKAGAQEGPRGDARV